LKNILFEDRGQQQRLEHLAIAVRPDQMFQIIIAGTEKVFLHQIYETTHHCLSAAIELEEIFDMRRLLEDGSSEAMENAGAIAQAHAHREQIELELAI
jgi:hypothetical protein